MLLSLILYGSRARGDHRLSSDVDLLGIVESGKIESEVATRGASFYAYPSRKILSNSQNGDLFVLHLIKEGRILHDTVDFFDRVSKSFIYKSTYETDIFIAHSVLSYLVTKRSYSNRKEYRKRLIWAVRTILIARSAEKKNPVFSSRDLADFSGISKLKEIIDKRNVIDEKSLFSAAELVGDKFGSQEVHINWPASQDAQEKELFEMGGIAASTVEIIRPKLFRMQRRTDNLPVSSFNITGGSPYELDD